MKTPTYIMLSPRVICFSLVFLSLGAVVSKPIEIEALENLEGVYYECVDEGDFALTFDDGPHLNTDAVLDVLTDHGVKATFFIQGNTSYRSLDDPASQATLRRISREGHQIGSHTWSHLNLTSGFSREEIRNEIKHVEDKIHEILGFKPNIMRPPFGSINETVRGILHEELGYKIIIWNLDTRDWANEENVDKSMENYHKAMEGVSSRNSSFIALHHDPRPGGAILATRSINYIHEKGYTPVLIAKCIGEISI